ncbi:MAG: hypothetical protein K8M05_41140 [Deltaproteobacteria bacterium]|nr:hypothetical protein [Kofleriaceae bacterium]
MFDDDDYGSRSFMGPMYLLSMMTPVLVVMMITSLLFPLLLYVIARWRDHRAPVADPQLGLKFALHFFRVQSYQLLLFGTAMLVYSMLSKEMRGEMREMIYRPAFGFLVPAGIVFGVATAMLGRTNNYTSPAVGRLFNGYNLMLSGFIGFAALIWGFQALFQKGSSGELGRLAWTGILVYTTAWVVQGAIFGRSVLEATPPQSYEPPSSSSGEPPPSAMPGPMQKPLA